MWQQFLWGGGQLFPTEFGRLCAPLKKILATPLYTTSSVAAAPAFTSVKLADGYANALVGTYAVFAIDLPSSATAITPQAAQAIF